MFLSLFWMLACGEPAPPASTPVPPTVDIEHQVEPTPEWTDLKGFLPSEPAMPAPFRGLVVGAPAAAAQQVLEAQVGPGTKVRRLSAGGRKVLQLPQLRDFPTVGATVVLDPTGENVASVQLALPATDGESALVRAWGDADGLVLDDGGQSAYVWQGRRHVFTWKTTAGDPVGRLLIEARAEEATKPTP